MVGLKAHQQIQDHSHQNRVDEIKTILLYCTTQSIQLYGTDLEFFLEEKTDKNGWREREREISAGFGGMNLHSNECKTYFTQIQNSTSDRRRFCERQCEKCVCVYV